MAGGRVCEQEATPSATTYFLCRLNETDIGCPATADVLSKEENKFYALEDLILPLPLEVTSNLSKGI
jgi:hypothetical protein